MRSLIILVVLAIANSIKCDSGSFSYEDTSIWKDTNPSCGYQHQTPINLEMKESLRICPCTKLSITNFHVRPKSLKISNTGVFVGWTHVYEAGMEPTISGGPLGGDYKFYGMHLHWGENDTIGSEHTINGYYYSAELHMIFTNKKYADINEAKQHYDGLAVFGIVLRVVPGNVHSCLLDEMILKKLTNPGDSYQYKDDELFAFVEILPKKVFMWPRNPPCSLDNYFHYRGSLTTPGCDEIVSWIVSTRTIRIKPGSLDPLRALFNSHQKKMTRNYRDLQPLNNRKVDIFGDFYPKKKDLM